MGAYTPWKASLPEDRGCWAHSDPGNLAFLRGSLGCSSLGLPRDTQGLRALTPGSPGQPPGPQSRDTSRQRQKRPPESSGWRTQTHRSRPPWGGSRDGEAGDGPNSEGRAEDGRETPRRRACGPAPTRVHSGLTHITRGLLCGPPRLLRLPCGRTPSRVPSARGLSLPLPLYRPGPGAAQCWERRAAFRP